MNYQLEMNYHEDVIESKPCFTLSIGANNNEEFKWIIDNLVVFRTESVKYYHRILKKVLSETNTYLYVINVTRSDKEYYDLEKISIANEDTSFFDKHNNHAFCLLKKENEDLRSCISKDTFIEMYNAGCLFFKLHDYYIEGNSITFYSKNQEQYVQVEKVATMYGFHMI